MAKKKLMPGFLQRLAQCNTAIPNPFANTAVLCFLFQLTSKDSEVLEHFDLTSWWDHPESSSEPTWQCHSQLIASNSLLPHRRLDQRAPLSSISRIQKDLDSNFQVCQDHTSTLPFPWFADFSWKNCMRKMLIAVRVAKIPKTAIRVKYTWEMFRNSYRSPGKVTQLVTERSSGKKISFQSRRKDAFIQYKNAHTCRQLGIQENFKTLIRNNC